jgi:hypothetical protein
MIEMLLPALVEDKSRCTTASRYVLSGQRRGSHPWLPVAPVPRGPGVLVGDAASTADELTWLERGIKHVADQAACRGDPVFLPRDESSAWAWLPLGIREAFCPAVTEPPDIDTDIHFAFGDAAKGTTGFRVTHQQALAA